MKSKPALSAIVAMDTNRLIGKDNGIPWHISADFKYFKAQTLNKPVVMGRLTWDSIGRPLPQRDNIVISRDANLELKGAYVVTSIDAAIAKAKELNPDVEEIMFMGGVTIYEQVLPRLDRLYLTQIDYTFEGDAWFPEFDHSEWCEVSRQSHEEIEKNFTYHFILLERNLEKAEDNGRDEKESGEQEKSRQKDS